MENSINNYGQPNAIAETINDDISTIAYRPKLTKITGSVLSAILLQQMMYWAKRMNNKFYKFMQPCKHPLYKEGQSWCEELGFTKAEFETALRKIAFKLGKRKDPKPKKEESKYKSVSSISKEEALIIYYTDANRVTWYSVNWNAVNEKLNEIYLVNMESRNSKLNTESINTKENIESGNTNNIDYTENNLTETTVYREQQSYSTDTKIDLFYSLYEEYYNKEHTKLSKNKLIEIGNILFNDLELDYTTVNPTIEEEKLMIIKYFNTNLKTHTLLHYCSGDIRKLRYLEVIGI
jgi:hypothetical protein